MLGKNEKARTLLSWGFLDEVVTREALDQAVIKMAADYSSRPPVAVQMIKQSINAVSSALDAAVTHMDADQNLLTGTTEDSREGIMAFREKRDPKFRGN